jgi:(4S)-4-hydroxy-5-phosphonooxypentane-2,3-dione isomerase
MIVLVAKYYAKPGNTDAIESTLRTMSDLVRRHEPECKLYQVSRSQDDPNLFLLYEHYTDEAALAAHRETPHFKEHIEGTIVPLLEKRERELYELAIS